jgi:DNA replication protein DnaC
MDIKQTLKTLGLPWMADNMDAIIATAGKSTHSEVLEKLLDGEIEAKRIRSALRRIRDSRVSVPNSLAEFNWAWPKKIDQELVKDLYRLAFVKEKANVVLMGGVGLGKTRLASGLIVEACHRNLPSLFTTAVEMLNNLQAAAAVNGLARAIRRYVAPATLCIDELGFLPIDRQGADLFFQVISARHERGSTLITTNRSYREWATTFANDAALTSAILDRLTEKCHTVVIEGKSYRMRNKTEK